MNQRVYFSVCLPLAFATSFGVKAVMKTSVLLTWELPENFKSQGLFKVGEVHKWLISYLITFYKASVTQNLFFTTTSNFGRRSLARFV